MVDAHKGPPITGDNQQQLMYAHGSIKGELSSIEVKGIQRKVLLCNLRYLLDSE